MNPFMLLDFHFPDDLFFESNQIVNFDDCNNDNELTMNVEWMSNSQAVEKKEGETTSSSSNVENDFSPISCDSCRSQHRKCDRKKPTCHACQLRGTPCNYTTTTNCKRKPKATQNNTCLKEEDVAILDLYFVEPCYQMVSRQELEQFLLSSNKQSSSPNSDTRTFSNNEMKELAALYYSIKATCECQMGQVEKSEQSAKQAKEHLSQVFDSYSSLRVACSYLNLCLYELWFERLDTSKFYFHILLFFKEGLKNDPSQDEKHKAIFMTAIYYLEHTIFNTQDKKNLHEMTFERFLIAIPAVFTYFKTDQLSESNHDWEYYLKNPHLIDSTNCMEVNALVQTLFNEAKRYEQVVFGNSSLVDLYYEFAENGCRIALLSKCSNRTPMIEYTIESSAQSIVNAIRNPKFNMLPFDMLLHISFAAEYHFQKVIKAEVKRNITNDLEMLKTELKAYHLLQSRYKIAKFYFYGGVFKKIEDHLNTLQQC
ncbi:hypothetical protein C9374_007407 [Naegleria lovaniensis]|uniref:Zn(2)-C6 fungal-type domain-containing protein n=1 Tax=Naegleria lovaniensis TaxID=51637 RepID=A0AA88GN01_NAELO|nr:uncharacterized protein C9374_007407 [Naegleria lovaniensis]KAG2379268.1 hypothetical protein C9374_007407 [Naegleria lovaniensis]